jgi:hypothetical protein
MAARGSPSMAWPSLLATKARDKPPLGVVINGEIATLLSAGYQMFLVTPNGKRFPAQAEQLKALHEFEMDIKEALGLVDLYNTSLGTTSRDHEYDRVTLRDSGTQPKPWENKKGLAHIIR